MTRKERDEHIARLKAANNFIKKVIAVERENRNDKTSEEQIARASAAIRFNNKVIKELSQLPQSGGTSLPKFRYKGREYRQRHAVLNVIKDLAPTMTFAELQQAFPQDIIKRKSYKLFTPIDGVRMYSDDWKKRYFKDEILETRDGVKFYLWNQFGRTVVGKEGAFPRFQKAVANLGIELTEV